MVEIFLDQLAKPLQGAKRLLRQRGSEHLFPAYTLTIGTRTLYRCRNQKREHWKSGETKHCIEQMPSSRGGIKETIGSFECLVAIVMIYPL